MVIKVSLLSGAIASDGVLSIQSNGTTEAISISTAQVVTFANNPVITAGTANGVAYLNGSKVVTTGSALTFDGNRLAVAGSSATTNRVDILNDNGNATFRVGYDTSNNLTITRNTGDANIYLNATQSGAAQVWQLAGTEGMRLNSTGLGIGTSSPANKLDVLSTAFAIARFSRSGAGGSAGIDIVEGSGGYSRLATPGGTSNMSFRPGGTELMLLDSSGNLGLGVTPSADWASSGYKAFVVRTSFLAGSAAPGAMVLGNNAYNDGVGWKYVAAGVASSYVQNAGAHSWSYAASGTAGAAITFTQAMTLDASGNLALGRTSAGATLDIESSGGASTYWRRTGYSNRGTINVDGTNATLASEGALIFGAGTSFAERARIDSSGNLGIGTTSPNASAILDAQSTTKGVRFPNMTGTQKNAISSPPAGLVVFDTTLAKLCVYSGSAWQTITSI